MQIELNSFKSTVVIIKIVVKCTGTILAELAVMPLVEPLGLEHIS